MKKFIIIALITIVLGGGVGGWWAYKNIIGAKLESGLQIIPGGMQINVPIGYTGRATSKGLYLTRAGGSPNSGAFFTILGPAKQDPGTTELARDLARQQIVSSSKQSGFFKDSFVETLPKSKLFVVEEEGALEGGATNLIKGDVSASSSDQYFFTAHTNDKANWPQRKAEFLSILRSFSVSSKQP